MIQQAYVSWATKSFEILLHYRQQHFQHCEQDLFTSNIVNSDISHSKDMYWLLGLV